MNEHKTRVRNFAHLKPILFNKKQNIIKMTSYEETYDWDLKDVQTLELGRVKNDMNVFMNYAKLAIYVLLIIIFGVLQYHHYKIYKSYTRKFPMVTDNF